MKQASFWEPLSIRCPHVKFSTLYYFRFSDFMSLVYKTDYRKAILHGGHKVVVLYMQTHSCIPKSCWVVGKGVGELFIIKNSGQLSVKLYCLYNYSSENKVPVFAMLSSVADTIPYLWRLLSRECTYRRMCEYIHVQAWWSWQRAGSCPNEGKGLSFTLLSRSGFTMKRGRKGPVYKA